MFEGIKNAIARRAIDQLQQTPITTENLYEKNKGAERIADLTGVQPNLLTGTWEDKKGTVVRKIRKPSWSNE